MPGQASTSRGLLHAGLPNGNTWSQGSHTNVVTHINREDSYFTWFNRRYLRVQPQPCEKVGVEKWVTYRPTDIWSQSLLPTIFLHESVILSHREISGYRLHARFGTGLTPPLVHKPCKFPRDLRTLRYTAPAERGFDFSSPRIRSLSCFHPVRCLICTLAYAF